MQGDNLGEVPLLGLQEGVVEGGEGGGAALLEEVDEVGALVRRRGLRLSASFSYYEVNLHIRNDSTGDCFAHCLLIAVGTAGTSAIVAVNHPLG